MTLTIRPALPEDLPTITAVWMRAEKMPDDVSPGVPTVLPHILATGMMVVAEENGTIVGFGSSFTRSNVRFMGQLFIDPGSQSGGVGRALMEAVMPHDGAELATIASPDRRAVSLYTRHGMFPLWPVYGLKADVANLRAMPASPVRMVQADRNDPALVRMDAEIGGRHRPEDLDYLFDDRGGVPFWMERDGARIGYCILQVLSNSADGYEDEGSVRIGPLGVHNAVDMTDCIRAAVTTALDYGTSIDVLAPGPGDAFRILLDAGLQIRFVDTFMSSNRPPFVDALRMVPGSGGTY